MWTEILTGRGADVLGVPARLQHRVAGTVVCFQPGPWGPRPTLEGGWSCGLWRAGWLGDGFLF